MNNKYTITGNILLSSAFLSFDTKEQFKSAIEQAVLIHISLKYKRYYNTFSNLKFTHHQNLVGNCVSYEFQVYDTPSAAKLSDDNIVKELELKIQNDKDNIEEVTTFREFGTAEKIKFSKIINTNIPSKVTYKENICEIEETIPTTTLPEDIPFVDLISLDKRESEDEDSEEEPNIKKVKYTPKVDIPYLKFNCIRTSHVEQLYKSLNPPVNNES